MKLIHAKIYIQENQIQLISSHEIYHLHFLKERRRAGETGEPMTRCTATNIYKGFRAYCQYLRWSSWQRLLTDTNC